MTRLSRFVLALVVAALASACHHTAQGVKDDTRNAVRKTGEGVQKAGEKIEGVGKK